MDIEVVREFMNSPTGTSLLTWLIVLAGGLSSLNGILWHYKKNVEAALLKKQRLDRLSSIPWPNPWLNDPLLNRLGEEEIERHEPSFPRWPVRLSWTLWGAAFVLIFLRYLLFEPIY